DMDVPRLGMMCEHEFVPGRALLEHGPRDRHDGLRVRTSPGREKQVIGIAPLPAGKLWPPFLKNRRGRLRRLFAGNRLSIRLANLIERPNKFLQKILRLTRIADSRRHFRCGPNTGLP
ncbi:hypothetical protein, partial [Mesorhizobium sp. M4A.F.Ca.ET.050.02.1.1]|uniref:hypothetical protein n=1 Tax=Mesorhizobium sp. M4A.F.Ca.ET.050.02.1.1 TaxID=2496754 RepID=UPI001AECB623